MDVEGNYQHRWTEAPMALRLLQLVIAFGVVHNRRCGQP
jgi:hypothetical protein